MATDDNHLNVRKISHKVTVMLDADGTPLWLGERMVEVAPGEWTTPAMEDFLQLAAKAALALDERLIP